VASRLLRHYRRSRSGSEAMSELDQAWEAINALGGWVADSDTAGKSYNDAISAALAEIEKLGGMDPIKRT
jgi:hypothetical protein